MNAEHINPAYYKSGNIEVIDILKEKFTYEQYKGFLKGIILKYIIRADQKNGAEDYAKAEWYLKRLLDEVLKHEDSEHISDK